MIRLGMIGCGGRGQGLMDLIDRLGQDAKLVTVADPRADELREELADKPWIAERVDYFTEADRMLQTVDLDGVLVATRCSLHARMACKALARNLPLYLEKPVATNIDDWRMLKAAHEKRGD